jgi:hypothetical protein
MDKLNIYLPNEKGLLWNSTVYRGLLITCNVKTVKEQTFHKRSTNVPMSNRNETKKPLSSSEFVLSKVITSILPRRAGSGQNWNNLFSTREIWERYQKVLVSFPKRYRNVCPSVFDVNARKKNKNRKKTTLDKREKWQIKHISFIRKKRNVTMDYDCV